MFVGKQFDIVLGVDIHIVQPPGPVPPVPIPHPFVGMVYDPMEFVPILGASILANGLPRAQAGTTVKATVPHIPIGGVFVKPPSNDGEIFMGSISVPSEGEPFGFLGCPVLTCQDAGMVSIPRPKRKSKSKPKSLVLPMSVLLPVPKGGMNVSPTGMTISLLGMAMKLGMKMLGKLAKKVGKKAGKKATEKAAKEAAEKAAKEAKEKAAKEAKKWADELAQKSKKKPHVITVVVDSKTGKVYKGTNKGVKNLDDVDDALKKKLPNPSKEKWSSHNCAEVDAYNQALKDGAKWEDLQHHTLGRGENGSFGSKAPCRNCAETFLGK